MMNTDLTVDTITDEQIRELRHTLVELCSLALARFRDPQGRDRVRAARAYCAKIINDTHKETAP
jgi:hypothetical protein